MICEMCNTEMYEDSFETGISISNQDMMTYCLVWICPKCNHTISRKSKVK